MRKQDGHAKASWIYMMHDLRRWLFIQFHSIVKVVYVFGRLITDPLFVKVAPWVKLPEEKPCSKKIDKNKMALDNWAWSVHIIFWYVHCGSTYRGKATHTCVCKLGHHGFKQWLVACEAPILNKCWFVAYWTLGNKRHWNWNINGNKIIKENAVCTMAAILFRLQCDHNSMLYSSKAQGREYRHYTAS